MFQVMASDADLPSSREAALPLREAPRAGPEDIVLLRAVARGERWALAALYDRYAGLLLGTALRMLRESSEAEDLVHDVFMEVHRHAGEYDPARGSVRTWLCVRTRSRALDRLRAPGRTRRVRVEPQSAGFEAAADTAVVDGYADHDAARVRVALAALGEAQRAVLELAYFEGLSCSEIAAALAVPIGTVKSRARAALEHLRAALVDG